MGPEAEFFVFDDVRFDQSQPNAGYYFLDSVEGAWNSGREEFPNLGYKTRHKEGYFPVPPTDTLGRLPPDDHDDAAWRAGVEVEVGHHEVASRRAVRDRHEVQAAHAVAPTSSCGSSTS